MFYYVLHGTSYMDVRRVLVPASPRPSGVAFRIRSHFASGAGVYALPVPAVARGLFLPFRSLEKGRTDALTSNVFGEATPSPSTDQLCVICETAVSRSLRFPSSRDEKAPTHS